MDLNCFLFDDQPKQDGEKRCADILKCRGTATMPDNKGHIGSVVKGCGIKGVNKRERKAALTRTVKKKQTKKKTIRCSRQTALSMYFQKEK